MVSVSSDSSARSVPASSPTSPNFQRMNLNAKLSSSFRDMRPWQGVVAEMWTWQSMIMSSSPPWKGGVGGGLKRGQLDAPFASETFSSSTRASTLPQPLPSREGSKTSMLLPNLLIPRERSIPSLRLARLETLQLETILHDRPRVFDRSHAAHRDSLHQR